MVSPTSKEGRERKGEEEAPFPNCNAGSKGISILEKENNCRVETKEGAICDKCEGEEERIFMPELVATRAGEIEISRSRSRRFCLLVLDLVLELFDLEKNSRTRSTLSVLQKLCCVHFKCRIKK